MLLSKKIAYGAICVSFIFILIGVATISPIFDLSLYTLASIFVVISVIISDIKFGFITYFVSSILLTAVYGLFFSIPFIIFFGVFPLIKALIESRFNKKVSSIFKLIYFVIITGMIYLFFNQYILFIMNKFQSLVETILNSSDIVSSFSILFGIIIVCLFFVYDYCLSGFISFFNKNIIPKLKQN